MSEENKRNIGIIWANPYNKNLGVGALAYSALAILNDLAIEEGINVQFAFFGSSKTIPDSIIIRDKKIEFKNVRGMDLLHWKSRIKLLFLGKSYQKELINSFDFVFDIAEGDSFTDIYGNDRFNRILNSKLYFAKKNIKQILLPQTIGPFKDKGNEQAAFNAMQKIRAVISRDKQSYDYTYKFLPNDKIFETIDVAFYLPFTQNEKKRDTINVGINVSGLLWNGGYTRNNQFGMKTDYRKLIIETLNYFTAQPMVQVHLISHVIPIDKPVEDDYAAAEELKQQFPSVTLSPRFESPIDAKSYISGMDFFTGARMHACIAAFSTGVPVFPMAYSRKFNGLFGDTLNYKFYGDCVNDAEDIIGEQLISAFNKRVDLKRDIDSTNVEIVKPRLSALKEIIRNQLNSI